MRRRPQEKPDVSLGPCWIKRTTPKAALCVQYGSTADMAANRDPIQEIWVPLSCISDDSPAWGMDDRDEVLVKGWWAEKEGIE